MSGDIIVQNHNSVFYAYHKSRFWRWDDAQGIWKESHLMAQKFERAKAVIATLTPEDFLGSAEFEQPDEYELDFAMVDALKSAKPCKTAPIEPVEEAEVPCKCSTCTCSGCKEECFGNCHHCGHPVEDCNSYQTGGEKHLASVPQDKPAAPSFDFGADEQTNALLLQDAQTFITGNMARIMAAKHAHDLCANNKNGTWGKWCDVVGISRDTGDNMVHIAEQFGNIQIDGQSIFDVRPMKLLYAAAKPSAPPELVEKVKSGEVATNKEYQALLKENQQLRTDRVNAMNQAEREKARADNIEAQLEATRADINGLTEHNTQLKENLDAAEAREEEAWKLQSEAEARAKDAENRLEGSRQVAEAAKLRADKYKAENEALRVKPIAAVVDEEEVDRRAGEKAYEIAAGMTAEYKARQEQDARSAYDSILLAGRSFTNTWQIAKPALCKLPPEQREAAANQLIHTLGQIQGEVSQCL